MSLHGSLILENDHDAFEDAVLSKLCPVNSRS